jgi:hypothetical protein
MTDITAPAVVPRHVRILSISKIKDRIDEYVDGVARGRPEKQHAARLHQRQSQRWRQVYSSLAQPISLRISPVHAAPLCQSTRPEHRGLATAASTNG